MSVICLLLNDISHYKNKYINDILKKYIIYYINNDTYFVELKKYLMVSFLCVYGSYLSLSPY